MIRNSVGREHSSRAIRLSASIGVRRFARMEWSWKMRSNLSNGGSARDADANLEIRFGRRLDLSASSLLFDDERYRHAHPRDADTVFDEGLIQHLSRGLLR